MMLEKKGYTVLVAANGDDALDLCQRYEDKIHLLLTDMVMPGMSGFELAKQVVGLRPHVRILYMSGYTNDSLDNAKEDVLGTLDFIQKPFTTDILVAKVQQVLL